MPSQAYSIFRKNLRHVDHILDAHKASGLPKKRGRRRLNHINRSALIILCASWEQYIEDVALNSVDALIECTDQPQYLPQPAQQNICATIAKKVRNDLELLTATITGDWKRIYKECARKATRDLHSPTCENVKALLNQSTGATLMIFLDPARSKDGARLDEIIDTRHKIAHRGVEHGPYTGLKKVTDDMVVISRLAKDTDNHLHKHLTGIHPKQMPPWDGRAQ